MACPLCVANLVQMSLPVIAAVASGLAVAHQLQDSSASVNDSIEPVEPIIEKTGKNNDDAKREIKK